MDSVSRTRSSKKHPLTVRVEGGVADEKESYAISSVRSSSRLRQSPVSGNNYVVSGPELAEFVSTNELLQSGGSSHSESLKGSSGARVRHFTRSKIPRSVGKESPLRDQKSQYGSEGANEREMDISIDACASILATLDERSYHKALLNDAHGIATDILQPMALPWMHNVVPVTRNIPCDIDDLTEILTADDGAYTPFENGPLGFGRFDIGQLRRGPLNTRLATSSDSFCTASRRSEDPGVIELSTVTLPPFPQNDRAEKQVTSSATTTKSSSNRHLSCSHDGSFSEGETSLCCFEEAQNRKRRKTLQTSRCCQKELVSVRINSSSSRSSIFETESKEKSRSCISFPKLLDATLPLEVQNGRFLSTSKARTIAEELGTYNWRHSLGPTNHSGKNSNRVSVGRTRLMWTEKSPADQPQRVFFTSLLSGGKLESSAQKRPRDIKVSIRVNGGYFGSGARNQDPSITSADDDTKLNSIDQSMSSTPHLYSRVIRDSRLLAEKYVHPLMQGVLDTEKLVRSILNAPIGNGELQASSDSEPVNLTLKTTMKPPRIDCIPDNNGVICVLCTSPGTVSSSSIHCTLNSAARQGPTLCTVCWSPAEEGSGDVEECCNCGVLAHLRCCFDPGSKESIPGSGKTDDTKLEWKCAVCCNMAWQHKRESLGTESSSDTSKKRRRKSRPPTWLKDSHMEPAKRASACKDYLAAGEIKCALCPYSGGAMSLVRVGGEVLWIHEVCRLWTDAVNCWEGSSDVVHNSCALCGLKSGSTLAQTPSSSPGTRSRCLVKCAAARCGLSFHPICAVLSSKLEPVSRRLPMKGKMEPEERKAIEDARNKDIGLSAKFTLTYLRCEGIREALGKNPGCTTSLSIPVAFCGIHNPNRETGFCGMYPGAKHTNDNIMRIPSIKE